MNDENKFKVESDVNKMAKATLDFFNVCKNNKINPWLDYGGLLGMIRSKELIPWNNDLHMCCFYEKDINDKMIKIVSQLSSMGYLAYYYPTVGALNIKKHNQDIDITLNIVWKENNFAVRPHEEVTEFSKEKMSKNYKLKLANWLYWISRISCLYFLFNFKLLTRYPNYEKVRMILAKVFSILPLSLRKKIFIYCINKSEKLGAKYEKTAIPLEYYQEFIDIKFYEGQISVPKRNIELLEYLYGLDWETPKENWTFYMTKAKNVSQMQYIKEKWLYDELDLI